LPVVSVADQVAPAVDILQPFPKGLSLATPYVPALLGCMNGEAAGVDVPGEISWAIARRSVVV
jgi:hypothetical protein